ncbi:Wall-associated receptor kinase 2 [Bienertia sinuspersici]
MFEIQASSYLFPWFFLISFTMTSFASLIAKPNCPTKCDGRCSLSNLYNINCNTSYNPPIPFIGKTNLEVVEITKSQIRIKTVLNSLPFVFSDTSNKFTVVGCNDASVITAQGTHGRPFQGGCVAVCTNPQEVINGSCSGTGCCQTSIPKGLKVFIINSTTLYNHTNVSLFNPCSYAFLAEQDKFENVPVVLDWFVGENLTCVHAQRNLSSYACQKNSNCSDFDAVTGGYRCSCLDGYDDVDECADPTNNPCSHICTNTPGSFICSCPPGHRGDGLINGTGCITYQSSQFVIRFTLDRVFKYIQNSSDKKNSNQKNSDELNIGVVYKLVKPQRCILGQGGYGTVYKGTLEDGREVAIKKSKVADQAQVEQFINEVVILTHINHRNVVKLLGCCLETEVPLLVYEFISNGTLFDHIHRSKSFRSWLTWDNCIRVASEALMHLHIFTQPLQDQLVPIDQTRVTTLVQGTLGYLDPEYFQTSQLTEKSDVYSFGVVLAELLTKEKPLSMDRKMEERNLATYFIVAMKEDRLMEIIDPQLMAEANEEQLATMAKLIRECLNLERQDRPTMKEVAFKLDKLKQNKYPSSRQNEYNQTTDIVDQDLYPVPSSNGNTSVTSDFSGQYLMQNDLISEMNHAR